MTKEKYRIFRGRVDIDLLRRIIDAKTKAEGTGAFNPENRRGSETGKGLRILYEAAIDRIIHIFTGKKGEQ